MNIKILDSWLREYLKTDAKPKDFSMAMSLTSVSIEKIEKYKDDIAYDIEVTTNRPDLMSVIGLAREAAAVLPQFGIDAKFIPPKFEQPKLTKEELSIRIVNDPKLVNRVMAVVLEVTIGKSPQYIQDRLEADNIRTLNNVIDVTNYVMRTIGHPTHVFDFDRLNTKTLTIKEANKGDKVTTLDGKSHSLLGGDIVAVDDSGRIVDLLGIMGLENSVVTDATKRILFFIDNNEPLHMRRTSMGLAIRTEAAQVNEKGIDPEQAEEAMFYGIKLFQDNASGKILSNIIDQYPNKPNTKTVQVSEQKINQIIGVPINLTKARKILESLGFKAVIKNELLVITVPTHRLSDVDIPEDVVEEIARVHGYHNLPSIIPQLISEETKSLLHDSFFWETRAKNALKYWGFTETYTYSMVAEELYEGPTSNAVTLKNPLTEDGIYMRRTIVPSLLQITRENKSHKTLKIFEIANVYEQNNNDLPKETRTLAGLVKHEKASFYEVKGIIEQLAHDFGIQKLTFKQSTEGTGADVFVGREKVGDIEILADNLVDFEFNFDLLIKNATLKKSYTPISKFPHFVEDLAFIVPENVTTGDIIQTIEKVDQTIQEVSLLDRYQDTRTFHIVYLDKTKNLTSEDVAIIRKEITKTVGKKLNATLKN